jgi:hypothetical protein
MALGSTQPLTEMILGVKSGQHEADDLTTICKPIV